MCVPSVCQPTVQDHGKEVRPNDTGWFEANHRTSGFLPIDSAGSCVASNNTWGNRSFAGLVIHHEGKWKGEKGMSNWCATGHTNMGSVVETVSGTMSGQLDPARQDATSCRGRIASPRTATMEAGGQVEANVCQELDWSEYRAPAGTAPTPRRRP